MPARRNDRSAGKGRAGRLNPADGRDLAVLSLRRQSEHAYVRDTLSDIASEAHTPPEQVAFALELALGVMRHRLTLARLVRELLTGGWQTLPPDIRHILLVGAYQLLYLDSIPEYAAVSEAVAQARRAGHARLGKLVNGVLRNVQRHIAERVKWSADVPRRRAIRYAYDKAVVLTTDLLADPAEDPVGYLSIATSLPTEIVTRWIHAFGKEQAERICWASQWRPPVVLRPNRLKTDGARLLATLKEEGIEGELDKESDSVFVAGAGGITHWKAFREGLCQVQDVTAQQAVIAAQLRPGKIVFDLAAGAGTKSTQAAEIMKNDGLVIAHDVAVDRLDRIAANAGRLGIEIIEVVRPDGLEAILADYDLDVILVDVPCSNTGVFARRPEAKYRQTPQSLASLKKQQIEILRRAMALGVDAGASRIVYSTCSIEPEEDEQVIQEVLTGQSEWIVTDAHLFQPTFKGPITSWRDGGYVAVIDSAVKGG